MATTPSTSGAPSDPVTAPLSSTSSHSSKPFLRPPPPPLFLGKPINLPPPQGGALYPVGPTHRGFPPRPADRMVTVANPAGYIRNSSPTAVMTFAAAQARPFVFAPGGDPPPVHAMRPPPPQVQHTHQFVVPRQLGGPPKGVPVTAHPKVAPFPTISLAPEDNISNDRDKSREDTVVMIHDRKVRLLEGGSGSLYALCRSWVRNGLPQESQPNIGDGLKILPKPLPASMVDSHMLKKSEDINEAEDSGKEEDLGHIEQLSACDLLKGHIKRAKRVRARLRKERLLRIERYKQRLSLLLPTQMELIGRNDATPGS